MFITRNLIFRIPACAGMTRKESNHHVFILRHFKTLAGYDHFIDTPVADLIDADGIGRNIQVVAAIQAYLSDGQIVDIAFEDGFLRSQPEFFEKSAQIVQAFRFGNVVRHECNHLSNIG